MKKFKQILLSKYVLRYRILFLARGIGDPRICVGIQDWLEGDPMMRADIQVCVTDSSTPTTGALGTETGGDGSSPDCFVAEYRNPYLQRETWQKKMYYYPQFWNPPKPRYVYFPSYFQINLLSPLICPLKRASFSIINSWIFL